MQKKWRQQDETAPMTIWPPTTLVDPVVSSALEKLAAEYSEQSQKEAHNTTREALSEPSSAASLALVTKQLNQEPMDPLTRAALSTPGVYETLLGNAIQAYGQPAEDAATALSQAIQAVIAAGQQFEEQAKPPHGVAAPRTRSAARKR